MPGSPYADWDIVLADGSVRSGKTIAMITGFILWALDTYERRGREVNLILAGRTMGALKRNVLRPMFSIMAAMGIPYRYNRSENYVQMGSLTLYCFGANNEASQDVVQGLTAGGALLDEAALMPESFVQQAIARCSEPESKVWMNCNPEGPYHWLKLEYIDHARKRRVLRLHFTMDDNLTLTPGTRERYERAFSGLWYRRYVLGQWVAADGAVYDMFDLENHVVSELPAMRRFWVAVDYGTNNPTVFLLVGLGIDDRLYVCREWRWGASENQRSLTDAQYSQKLRECLDRWALELLPPPEQLPRGVRREIVPERIFVDPSAASFVTQLYYDARLDHRLRGVTTAPEEDEGRLNSVVDGIRNVSNLLVAGRLVIHSSCAGLIREMTGYLWDTEYAQRTGRDRPLKQHDHGPDALRYCVNGTRVMWLRWLRKEQVA